MTGAAPAVRGVVAAGHPATAEAGAAILAAGGNAVDAAVAATAAAATAESPLTSPAAGGFLIARTPGGEVSLLDFFVQVPGLGPAGRRLRPEMLDSFDVPFGGAVQTFHIGPASVAVPGMVHGMVEAVERLGRLPLREVLAPAVRIAREGVVVTPEVRYLHEILEPMLRHTPECAALYAPQGHIHAVGERFRMPALAESWEEIAAAGAPAMTEGRPAEALLAFMERSGGLVTRDDLRSYRAVERAPLTVRRGGMEVLTNPPPSAGGTLILAALAGIDPDVVGDDIGYYREVVEAGERANALRDPAFLDRLHEPGFAHALLGLVARKPTGTTNVSVIDADGGMAVLSSSAGSGGGVAIPGTGILLNNMLGEADLNPAGFGLQAPGTRMTSMMAPTLVLSGGHPMLAVGSAGSNRLRSAILQTLLSVTACGLRVRDAVARPRVHPEGDGVDVEYGVPSTACEALAAAGYRLRRWQTRNLFFGGVSAVTWRDGRLDGAGDPRRGGAAAGVTADGEVIAL